MAKYQNPAFDKDRYWESRRQDFMQRKMVRLAKKQQNTNTPDTVRLNPLTKKAFLKNTKRARQFQAIFDRIQLESVDA